MGRGPLKYSRKKEKMEANMREAKRKEGKEGGKKDQRTFINLDKSHISLVVELSSF